MPSIKCSTKHSFPHIIQNAVQFTRDHKLRCEYAFLRPVFDLDLIFSAVLLVFTRGSLLRYQTRLYSAACSKLKDEISSQLEEIRNAGTFKEERVITSKQDNLINVEGSNKQVLNFCANNYLGLSVGSLLNLYYNFKLGLHSLSFYIGNDIRRLLLLSYSIPISR